ncbi:sensor histidine kinase [Perlabentimonas gracilis]|uniref:sensor histidine kinase n=1 Tax=Perlabentimonas gracilis TaxID=2715279 RepID=UPI001409AD3D|nr:histidine kinase N-terminal 7TM domain-containing protein [Perlabentimonas gracilis]NHB69703.1 PAS domain-containing protein [Perlabentimonas gracilis]
MIIEFIELRVYLLILIVSSVITGILALYVWLKRTSINTPSLFGLLMAISLWSFGATLEILANTIEVKSFFNFIVYTGIVSIPVFLFVFTIEFTQNFKRYKKYINRTLWIIPLTSLLFLATNRFHGLFYEVSGLSPRLWGDLYFVEYGVWWWVHTAYSYTLILSSIFLLVRMVFLCSPIQRGVIKMLLLSALIPLVTNMVYIFGVRPMGFVDITPVGFMFTGVIFFWAIYKKNFFRVKPIALNTLFDSLPEGIIVVNLKEEIVDINVSAALLLRLTGSNPLGQRVKDVIPYFFDFSNSKAFNKIHFINYGNFYLEIEHSVIAGEKGGVLGYMVRIKDVTQRTMEGKKLKAATQRLELASHAAGLDAWENDLITGTRVGGVKVYLELGYTKEEIPDSMYGIYQLIHPDDLSDVIKTLEEHFEGESTVYSKDFRIRDKKGEYQWVANYARVVERDSAGKPLRLVGITQNINQRKLVEDRIRRQNEDLIRVNAEKDKFFSIIAHDLKGPFQGFIGLTELMSGSIDEMDKDELQSIIRTLNITAKNLYELLDNLLNWAVVKRGHKKFDPQKLHLALLFDDVREIVDHMADQKGILLTSSIPTGLNVLADKESLRTIFRNLVSNAIKFTPSGGSVTLKAYANDKGYVVVSVADTGIGMPDQIKKNLFSISTKVSRPGTNNEPSTGLGLILCKELVEKHGGTIWVESHEGQGSTIYFTVPAAN